MTFLSQFSPALIKNLRHKKVQTRAIPKSLSLTSIRRTFYHHYKDDTVNKSHQIIQKVSFVIFHLDKLYLEASLLMK